MFLRPRLNLGRPKAGSAFSPLNISDLEFWFDADDASTITEVGGEVSQWNDKSGNGRNVTQLSATEQPNKSSINGNNSLFYDGAEVLDLGSLSITSDTNSVFTAITTTTTAGTRYIYAGNDAIATLTSYLIRSTLSSVSVTGTSGGGDSNVTVANSQNLNTTIGVIGRHANSTTGVAEDTDGNSGSDVSVGSLLTPITDIYVGARIGTGANGWIGHIHELGFYSRRLDDTEKDQILDYLKAKWSL